MIYLITVIISHTDSLNQHYQFLHSNHLEEMCIPSCQNKQIKKNKKNKTIFMTVLRGGKLLNTLFSLVLGEKIKNFLFSLPSFGRDNKKKLIFHDFWVKRK